MNLRIVSAVVILITALLLVQSISVVDAHHNDNKDAGAARKTAETKSADYDNEGNLKTTIKEKRDAFLAYKAAFDAWKIAKEDYKAAKTSGVQTTIDAKKVILDAAKITKDKAWKTYQDTKKKNAR